MSSNIKQKNKYLQNLIIFWEFKNDSTIMGNRARP